MMAPIGQRLGGNIEIHGRRIDPTISVAMAICKITNRLRHTMNPTGSYRPKFELFGLDWVYLTTSNSG